MLVIRTTKAIPSKVKSTKKKKKKQKHLLETELRFKKEPKQIP